MDHAARLEIVEAENDELRERIVVLEQLLGFRKRVPIEWSLTAQEARLVGCLLSREVATKDALMAALYRNDGRDEAEIKIVDVIVCKARKKLRGFGVQIGTVWGTGYAIDRDTRARVNAQLDAEAAE